MTILLSYVNDDNRTIEYRVSDWDAVYALGEVLVNAPVDTDSLQYVEDNNKVGVFNLYTFERS